ncbi:hypothetical protein [Accumulibacter sp.]|uniref:hypothetical protein n=1 Tax=Accumulibacter sp. TaxID=2053492 RepID=UPI0025FAF5BE|nr:hypothetical protein [Accumulibacter sp.]MCM8596697.1 hypothetical protein [Accumulibacter sp.]MCM8624769.1 hypothetical protein [Accumulibacter sp.]MDS4050845.1 hypothetical protein [Accumulibacter sp.]
MHRVIALIVLLAGVFAAAAGAADSDDRRVDRCLIATGAAGAPAAVAEAATSEATRDAVQGSDPLLAEIAKVRFELLHDALKAEKDSYTKVVWSSFSLLLIALGWLLTSRDARQFLRDNPGVRGVALSAVLVVAAVHTVVLGFHVAASQRIVHLLAKDCYVWLAAMGEEYYAQDALTWGFLPVSLLINGPLFVLLACLLHRLRLPE